MRHILTKDFRYVQKEPSRDGSFDVCHTYVFFIAFTDRKSGKACRIKYVSRAEKIGEVFAIKFYASRDRKSIIIRKTKRATLPERMVQKSKRNVRRKQNEAYHWCAFLCPCKVGGDLKIFRPGFAGVCGAVPGAPPPRSAIVFERPPNIVRRPFFLCSRFSLWVAARPLSLMLLRLSPCTRQRSAP